MEQKPRSAMSELAKVAIWPRVTTKSVIDSGANAINGAPPAFWHMRRWHMLAPTGAALTAAGQTDSRLFSFHVVLSLSPRSSERPSGQRHQALRAARDAREMRAAFGQHTRIIELGEREFGVERLVARPGGLARDHRLRDSRPHVAQGGEA